MTDNSVLWKTLNNKYIHVQVSVIAQFHRMTVLWSYNGIFLLCCVCNNLGSQSFKGSGVVICLPLWCRTAVLNYYYILPHVQQSPWYTNIQHMHHCMSQSTPFNNCLFPWYSGSWSDTALSLQPDFTDARLNLDQVKRDIASGRRFNIDPLPQRDPSHHDPGQIFTAVFYYPNHLKLCK